MKKEYELIYQSNKYTLSRYNYTSIQKNIIYYMLEALQNDLKQENVFGDKIVYIPMKKITKDNHYNRIKSAVKNLREKTIEFKDGEGYDVITGVILQGKLKEGTGLIEIQISKDVIHLLKHSYKNFTAYKLTQAITLKSVYSKRIYELCHCWKNQGGQRISIDEFKHMLTIENKYKRINDFIKDVLEPAKKELENTDINFNYSLEKEGRAYKWINFKIIKKEEEKIESATPKEKGDNYTQLYSYLCVIFPEDKYPRKASNLSYEIAENRTKCKLILNKFKAKLKKYPKNKDFIKVSKHMLNEDFGIK